ncbi:MAG: EamA family transporter [Verrucomicrobia bacterium]|nr:EamA family transporter [Verrucomicrobiota bacterium]MDE3047401.1 EamA family transporter [Verrucomicrobiota bacterium]
MKLSHIFLIFFVVAVWGINFVFIAIGLTELPPILLCAARFFVVSIPAVFFFKFPQVPFRWVILYSLVMFVLQFALMFTGMHVGMPAGLSSILLQVQAFFSLFFAKAILKETIERKQMLGACVSFAGIFLIGWNLKMGASMLGFMLVLAAALTWGLGSITVKKMGKVQSGSLLVWSSLIAWPVLLGLSLCVENSFPLVCNLHTLAPATYGAILFIALGSTAFAFGTWNHLLQIYPLATVAPFTLLVPIFGMLSSMLVLGEALEPWKIIACLLVISGLCINLVSAKQKAAAKSLYQK